MRLASIGCFFLRSHRHYSSLLVISPCFIYPRVEASRPCGIHMSKSLPVAFPCLTWSADVSAPTKSASLCAFTFSSSFTMPAIAWMVKHNALPPHRAPTYPTWPPTLSAPQHHPTKPPTNSNTRHHFRRPTPYPHTRPQLLRGPPSRQAPPSPPRPETPGPQHPPATRQSTTAEPMGAEGNAPCRESACTSFLAWQRAVATSLEAKGTTIHLPR